MTTTPTSAAAEVDAAGQIRDGVRAVIVAYVEANPEARALLAERLKVPTDSVDKLLGRKVWDLPLALDVATGLGVRLHVSRG